jgi:DNA-binding GntR family transcriptional regulator
VCFLPESLPPSNLSRSPIREALQALENEGTVLATFYSWAIVKPRSAEEVLDMTEIRFALIRLGVRQAHPYFAPADFDRAFDLAKRITCTNRGTEAYECNRHFWDLIFEKARRPILWEMFTKLDNRMTRYYPLILQLYPTPESRPRQQEAFIELYRKGETTEALRAFKKIYLEIIDRMINHLNTQDRSEASQRSRQRVDAH